MDVLSISIILFCVMEIGNVYECVYPVFYAWFKIRKRSCSIWYFW